jgi:hypothetical protein
MIQEKGEKKKKPRKKPSRRTAFVRDCTGRDGTCDRRATDHHCFVTLTFVRWRIVDQYGYVLAVDAATSFLWMIQAANRSSDFIT